MKILWITNIMLPPLCEHLGLSVPVFGGWLYSSVRSLLEADGSLQLAVATVYKGRELQKHEVNGVTYYLLPLRGKSINKYNRHLEFFWKLVAAEYQPQLVHLHGTEYPHGLAFLKVCPDVKSVVSIQGLISVYDRYYFGGINFADVVRNITLRDFLKRETIFQGQREFRKGGVMESEMIKLVDAVIGRTSWDRMHVLAINPNIRYYFCNETLRYEFYKHLWNYADCEKHSIFISQAAYPLKGFHQVLKALPLVLRSFPDVKVYVGGSNIVSDSLWFDRLKRTGYGKYINRLLQKNDLAKHVTFLGILDERRMCECYLKSNVFVCPSAIENSPNSLGEAQIMGVPCIASYVGGVPDMMDGYKRGSMYRFEEVEMLAELICNFFRCDEYAEDSGSDVVRRRHDATVNVRRTLEIYKAVVD